MHKDGKQVSNTTDKPIVVFLEPWAYELELAPGETFDLVAESPDEGALEISVEDGVIVVYAWARAVVKVWNNGVLVLDADTPFPFPPGMSMKEFMGLTGLDKIR